MPIKQKGESVFCQECGETFIVGKKGFYYSPITPGDILCLGIPTLYVKTIELLFNNEGDWFCSRICWTKNKKKRNLNCKDPWE